MRSCNGEIECQNVPDRGCFISQPRQKRKRPAAPAAAAAGAADAAAARDSGAESPSVHRRKRSSRYCFHHQFADLCDPCLCSGSSEILQRCMAVEYNDIVENSVKLPHGVPQPARTESAALCRVRRPPIRTLSSGELPAQPGAPQGGSAAAAPPKAAGGLQNGLSCGASALGAIGGGGRIASVAAAELELEVGTLEVLAFMQAAAADSYRSVSASA